MAVTDGAEDAAAEPGVVEPAMGAPLTWGDARESDEAALLRLVRAGHDAAFAELFSRHATAVRGYALRFCTELSDAEDMAAEAFFRVLQAVRRGSGPADHIRGYLFTVVRRLAAEWSVRRRDVPVADEELSRQVDAGYAETPSRADLQLIALAFAALPVRWRTVLWRVEVEGQRPATVARHFGLSANATAALARRARQGLRAAYLQAHLRPANGGATGCRSVVDKLGSFTAGQMTRAEARRVSDHLSGCPSCSRLAAELADVCAGLRRYAGVLTPPLLGVAAGTGHRLLLGKTGAAAGKVAGKLATMGARAKLGMAAVSMAAVGGFGVAAGPIVAQFVPDHHQADRDYGSDSLQVGPPSVSSADASAPDTAGTDRILRSEFRGPRRTHPQPSAPSPSTGVVPFEVPVDSGQTPVGSSAPATSTAMPTTDGPSRSRSMQQANAPGNDAGADDPGNTAAGEPTTTTPSLTPTDSAPPTTATTRPTHVPKQTPGRVWRTSWTTNGTTVWYTVWSW